MPLQSGTRIGAYEITGQLGAGGMGEVYRATDTRLKRDVALKILPESFATDSERLARFQREAEVLASLNHPNIAAIYGLEESNGTRALIMELVDGPTLADHIAQGPIPVDEALPIAKQIAEALEAAHEQGIIHRDLKPANVKVRPDGTVKVLDFGLAKALEPITARADATASPTITSPAMMTGVGMLLGTAAYMSPEQARGQPTDKRSDVWAFGCVLYEMFTGRRAFAGDDVSDTLAAVLRSEPDWTALPANLPSALTDMVKGSLVKDRRRRIASLAVALFVLNGSSQIPGASRSEHRGFLARRSFAAVAALAAMATGAVGWWIGARRAPADAPLVTRFTVPLQPGERFSSTGRNVVAISPDGKYLAYIANNRLNLRAVDRLDAMPVHGTESPGGATVPGTTRHPFFSPDGQWVGFWQEGQLRKVGVNGGVPVPICTVTNPFGITWEDDGTILYAEGNAIWRVPDGGGQPEAIVRDVNGVIQTPQMVPGTQAVLFTVFPKGTIQPEIVIRSLATGEQKTVIRGGLDARYVETGHLVYFAARTLLAVPFNTRTLTVTGAPIPVTENVASGIVPGRDESGVAHVAISRSGTLAYVSGSFEESTASTLVWVNRAGREEPLGTAVRSYVYPRLSPDATRVALTVRDEERDIWIWDIGRKTLSRFTFDPADDRYSSWTPDARRIAFGSNRGGEAGLWWQTADGTGAPERLAAFPLNRYLFFSPTTWSPDASLVIGTATPGGGGLAGPSPTIIGPGTPDLWMLAMNGDRQPIPLLQTAFIERNAELSPDGRWIAYESLESGQSEVYVRPFPDLNAGKWQVSTGSGSQPLWARNGSELFFVADNRALMSARMHPLPSLRIDTPQKVLEDSYMWSVPAFAGRQYDVTPDGRFLVLKDASGPAQSSAPASVTVVQHFFEELKRLVPAN